ncbi:MAG: GIY-YIG nuclease family protein [Fusobacteriaceae bacterium]
MVKKAGMMEIAFTNGIVKADAKAMMLDLKDVERNLKKKRDEIFGIYYNDVKSLFIDNDWIGSDVIAVFQKELMFTNDCVELFKKSVDFYAQLSFLDKLNPKEKIKNKGFVYLMKCGDFFKIGKSLEIEKRRKQLQVGSAKNIEVIDFIECENYSDMEKIIQIAMRGFHERGEWFIASNKFIKNWEELKDQIVNCLIR